MVVAKCFWSVGWLVPKLSDLWWSRNVVGRLVGWSQTFRDHGGREMFLVGWLVGLKHFATMVVAKCLGPQTFRDHHGREMFGTNQPTNRPTNISRPPWSRNVWGPKHFATTMVAKCLGPTNQPTNKHFATTMVAKCLGPKHFATTMVAKCLG